MRQCSLQAKELSTFRAVSVTRRYVGGRATAASTILRECKIDHLELQLACKRGLIMTYCGSIDTRSEAQENLATIEKASERDGEYQTQRTHNEMPSARYRHAIE